MLKLRGVECERSRRIQPGIGECVTFERAARVRSRVDCFRAARNASGVDAKCGDQFLQTDFPLLVRPNFPEPRFWSTLGLPTIHPEAPACSHMLRCLCERLCRRGPHQSQTVQPLLVALP
jgi:hypothetical protein